MSKPLNLVLCWHMHQPYYRDGLDGEYRLPWVYLHGIKDYDDMAAHLERHPDMRVVVNFAPVLLEQLDDYAQQLTDLLNKGKATSDVMLNWLSGSTPIPRDPAGRHKVVTYCSRIHKPRMVDPYPSYQTLHNLFSGMEQDPDNDGYNALLNYLDEQYFVDMLVWYHLSWCGYSLKQRPELKELMEKGSRFTIKDRRKLIAVIQESLGSLIPRYRSLAERGQIELSMTPYGHPIVPLLNDFQNMRDAQPDAPAPEHDAYPDGPARARWHMEKGMQVFEHYFGIKPKGVWLSEGGVSDDSVAILDEMNIQWTASGEAVWHHSCISSSCAPDDMECRSALFIPYKLNSYQTNLFFRDDGLSDLIGFEYQKWHADDAVADFLQHMENIAGSLGDNADKHVVSVILDGENAWEYYPENGHHFLDALYESLSSSDQVKTTTFSKMPQDSREGSLSHLVAGSWVYGSFSTWIGSEDKNLAWDLLVDAKMAYDKVMKENKLTRKQQQHAADLLAICEGSDWFWWFGDYNPSGSVKDFDQLFRLQLKRLYAALRLTTPPALDRPISLGGGQMENAGTMRRN